MRERDERLGVDLALFLSRKGILDLSDLIESD
jgi:hypothetical protein